MKGSAAILRLATALSLGLFSRVEAQGLPSTLVFDGLVPDDADRYFVLPFEVPPGVGELSVSHQTVSPVGTSEGQNILDWGLDAPEGSRGWGGGNLEDAVVAADRTSRSYLTGPMTPGTWRVIVGKAKLLAPPVRYHVEVTLRAGTTLAPQPERSPYVEAEPLSPEARYYAGDFHVHSRDSGDARPSLDEILDLASARGLDFVVITDHNTSAATDLFTETQRRHPGVLLIPGAEVTTYGGHLNALGATRAIDHKIGGLGRPLDGQVALTILDVAAQVHAQGALLSINHPMLELGTVCIGCAWVHELPPEHIDAVEVGTGDVLRAGGLFTERSIAFWERLCETGRRITPIGGSDDHRAGADLSAFDSAIGSPTTMVFAESLSASAILEGVRQGRTVVKLSGPEDPMLTLHLSAALTGPLVRGDITTLAAIATGAAGFELRFVADGLALPGAVLIPEAPAEVTEVFRPLPSHRRVRAELVRDGRPRVVTGYVYLPAPLPEVDAGAPADVFLAADAGLAADAQGQMPTPAPPRAEGCAQGATHPRSTLAGLALTLAGLALPLAGLALPHLFSRRARRSD